MGNINTGADEQEAPDDYFENYEIKASDLETLGQDIDQLADSRLVEDGVLQELRFVTYDSKYLYVFTRGEHASNDRFQVEELPSTSTSGLRIFKIPNPGIYGKKKADYRGARSWLLCDEIETTAVGAQKFPNENRLYQPGLPQPERILDVVSMAPFEGFSKAKKKNCNYKTDVVFHEAGHIEHRRIQDWQIGDDFTGTFPSEAQKKQFLSVVQATNLFPEAIKALVLPHINHGAISEMYAMLIDREGAKLYDPIKYETEHAQHLTLMNTLASDSVDEMVCEEFTSSLQGEHYTGRLLVRILEDRFPDFTERKQFVRECLDPKQRL